MSLVVIVIVKFIHAFARVLKGVEVRAGRGATFGTGVAAPFVASLPAVRSRAPTSLSRGGHNCSRLEHPTGRRSLHHGCGSLVVASSYHLSHGRWQANKKHG